MTRTALLIVFLFGLIASSSGDPVPQIPSLDQTRVDDLGWTDAHHAAYGTPLYPRGATVRREDVADFLRAATDGYLCARNDFGQTALHLAVRQDHPDVVGLYARRRLCLDAPNGDGDTPLHYAAVWGRIDAARTLIGAGASPEARNKRGERPVDDARRQHHNDLVEMLEQGSCPSGPRLAGACSAYDVT